MAQAVSCPSVTVEARALLQASAYGISIGQRGTGTGFCPRVSVLRYLSFRPCFIFAFVYH
jgi:hypothetical protein